MMRREGKLPIRGLKDSPPRRKSRDVLLGMYQGKKEGGEKTKK